MPEQQIANLLQFVVVVVLWLIFLFKLLPTYRVDSFRQRMFAVRDELFDFAAAGNLQFDDPSYVLLRRQMNALIRYGHQITVYRLLMTYVIGAASMRTEVTSWSDAWEPSVAKIENEEIQTQMRGFHDRAVNIAVKHLIGGSPLLWAGMLAAAVAVLGRGAAMGLRQLLRAAANKILVGPLNRRYIEEEAFTATA